MPDRTRGAGTGSTPQVDPTTTRTRKRFARRQWARRWLAWRYVVAALLAIALVVGTVWLVFFSSVLAVQGVEVDGAQTLSEQEIRNVAAVPSGEPLARVDLDGVRARLEAMAVVRAAEVTRQWPDEVLIQVEERVPIAVVEIGGRIRGLDADGVVFRDYPSAPADLPRVRTSTGTGSDALREAAQVVAALPAALSRRVELRRGRHRRPDLPGAARRPEGGVGERGGIRREGQGAHPAAQAASAHLRRQRARAARHLRRVICIATRNDW